MDKIEEYKSNACFFMEWYDYYKKRFMINMADFYYKQAMLNYLRYKCRTGYDTSWWVQ